MEQASDCLRKWHWQYVSGRKPPEQQWQTAGKELHKEVEDYLTTGVKALGTLAMAGFWMLPDPGPDLLLERDLLVHLDVPGKPEITRQNSQAYLDAAPLSAGGVPVLGQLDCAHERGINKGGSDVGDIHDPDGTVEVIDWKTSSDFKWAKTGIQLLNTIQMAGYGKWFLNQRPDLRHVRLTHGYFRTKGAATARKVTYLASADQIHESWEHAEGVARLMNAATSEPDSNKVTPNLDACDKFRGCPHRLGGYCSAGMDAGVAGYLGLTASQEVKSLLNPASKKEPEKLLPMGSLLKKVTKTPSPAADTAPDTAAFEAAKAKLVAEERSAELAARIPPGFAETVKAVQALQVGFPKMIGSAADAYLAFLGKDPAPEVPGIGTYGYVEIDDPALMTQLLEDLKEAIAADSEAPTPSPIPPDAPMSDPRLAAETEEGEPQPKVAVQAVVEAAKKKSKPKAQALPETHKNHLPAELAGEILVKEAKTSGIRLYIDCIPSVPFTDLYDWCNTVATTIAMVAGSDQDGKAPVDIRMAPANSSIGYDKWRGALFAAAQDKDVAPLPDGDYYIDTRGSSVREVLADGLKARANLYVRSAR